MVSGPDLSIWSDAGLLLGETLIVEKLIEKMLNDADQLYVPLVRVNRFCPFQWYFSYSLYTSHTLVTLSFWSAELTFSLIVAQFTSFRSCYFICMICTTRAFSGCYCFLYMRAHFVVFDVNRSNKNSLELDGILIAWGYHWFSLSLGYAKLFDLLDFMV